MLRLAHSRLRPHHHLLTGPPVQVAELEAEGHELKERLAALLSPAGASPSHHRSDTAASLPSTKPLNIGGPAADGSGSSPVSGASSRWGWALSLSAPEAELAPEPLWGAPAIGSPEAHRLGLCHAAHPAHAGSQRCSTNDTGLFGRDGCVSLQRASRNSTDSHDSAAGSRLRPAAMGLRAKTPVPRLALGRGMEGAASTKARLGSAARGGDLARQ